MKLTLQQVADGLGISAPAVHRWENGTTSPSVRDAERVSQVFGITIEQLFRDPGSGSNRQNLTDSIFQVAAHARHHGSEPGAWLQEMLNGIRKCHPADDPAAKTLEVDVLKIEETEEFAKAARTMSDMLRAWAKLSPQLKEHWLRMGETYPV